MEFTQDNQEELIKYRIEQAKEAILEVEILIEKNLLKNSHKPDILWYVLYSSGISSEKRIQNFKT